MAMDLDGPGAEDRGFHAYGRSGLGLTADVTDEQAVAERLPGRRAGVRRGRHRCFQCRTRVVSADRDRPRSRSGTRNHDVLAKGYFPGEPGSVPNSMQVTGNGGRGSSSLPRRTRSSPARTRRPTAPPRPLNSTSRAAWPRREVPAGSGSTSSIQTLSCREAGSGRRAGEPSGRRPMGMEPDELDAHYRARTTLGVNILPEDIAEAVAFLRQRPLGQDDRKHAERRWRSGGGLSALADLDQHDANEQADDTPVIRRPVAGRRGKPDPAEVVERQRDRCSDRRRSARW